MRTNQSIFIGYWIEEIRRLKTEALSSQWGPYKMTGNRRCFKASNEVDETKECYL